MRQQQTTTSPLRRLHQPASSQTTALNKWRWHFTSYSTKSRAGGLVNILLLHIIFLYLFSSTNLLLRICAFVPTYSNTRNLQLWVVKGDNITTDPLTKDQDETQTTSPPRTLSSPLLDWNASGSIGSLLMQMQRREEEMRKLNQTLLLEQQKEEALDLSSTTVDASSSDPPPSPPPPQEKQSEIQKMEFATAKELDDAVTYLPDKYSTLDDSVTILELPPLYKALMDPREIGNETVVDIKAKEEDDTAEFDGELPVMPLSRPDHYRDRIGRDLRHLAVSIASSVEDADSFRLFCQQTENSGVMPLVECIHEGATMIREQQTGGVNMDAVYDDVSETAPQFSNLLLRQHNFYEENFMAASSACRVLRDLCAISPELSAVVIDNLLRANAAYYDEDSSSSLMADFCTILQYAHHNTEFDSKRRARRVNRIKRKPRIFKRNKAQSEKSSSRRQRRESRLRCKLYVIQLLLAMTVASDSAVDAMRSTGGLREAVVACSSYARKERTRRWLRYPGEMIKWMWRSKRKDSMPSSERRRRPFIEATALGKSMNGKIQGTANQVLAALGYNQWIPKIPGQKGLRILCMDGGGARGMATVTAVKSLVDSLGGVEVADCFDMIVGTSTGAIIAFLVGLRRESSELAVRRYNILLSKIFAKTALSTPLLLFTTASYDETPFMIILSEILGDYTMLDSRGDPAVPLVFGVTSKMSSTPTHVALFRNYNYAGGELPDPFTIDPDEARLSLGLPLDSEHVTLRSNSYAKRQTPESVSPWKKMQAGGSRHPGSFRVLQRYALRASTAAPTFFRPVLMGGEMYCDGGIVTSNPTAIAIHEARSIYPDVPIELVVSLGTGGFVEQKSAPRIGWDGIIGQIVDSATDGEQIHHILEDILGEGGTARLGRSSVSNTRYMRFNPTVGLPDEYPIDVTDPEKLSRLKAITTQYMNEPAQKRKLQDIADILEGRQGIRKWLKW